MTGLATAAWIFGLLLLSVGWGAAMTSAIYGPSTWTEALGGGIGMGTPVYLVTSLGAGLVWALTKNRRRALVAWGVLILIAFVVLGIGAAAGSRKKRATGDAGAAFLVARPQPEPLVEALLGRRGPTRWTVHRSTRPSSRS